MKTSDNPEGLLAPQSAKARRHADAVRLEYWRNAHHEALLSLYTGRKPTTGLKLWRKLCVLERLAHSAAAASCNGESIRIYWPKFGTYLPLPGEYDFNRDENAWDHLSTVVKDCVRNILGNVPNGFFVNGDARGYALKLDPDSCLIPEGMHTDMGRNGILAAEIN